MMRTAGAPDAGVDRAGAPPRRGAWFVSLFMLDMWERFSFYGMLAILFLYAVDSPEHGGLGMPTGSASALVGTYLAAAFVAAMPGSWLGDRVLGTRRAALLGALGIAAGHTCLTLSTTGTFYLGLILLACGTGLLKPNMTALLGAFYGPGADRDREAGFSVFYMSIQISALAAPIVTGALGEGVDWHLGFGAAAVGMTFGIVCYLWGTRHFGAVGIAPADPAGSGVLAGVLRRATAVTAAVAALLAVDAAFGALRPQHVLGLVGLAVVIAPVLAFRTILRHPATTAAERARVRGYLWVFGAAAVFWALFSQSTSVLSLFAKQFTDREVLGVTVPASWFQALHPLFVLAGAPIAAALWPRLVRVGVSVKFAVGLALAGAAYLVMALAALVSAGQAAPGWLVVTYLAQSAGELALAPIGLSVTAAIAPAAFTSQMMGVWWLSAALGAAVGGQTARLFSSMPAAGYFLLFGLVPIAVAAVLGTFRRGIDRALAPPSAVPVP